MKEQAKQITPIPAAELSRNFGHYRMIAQRQPVPVTSHGRISNYLISAEEFEEFQRFKRLRQSFASGDLDEATVEAIAGTTMDPRHEHLDVLMDPD